MLSLLLAVAPVQGGADAPTPQPLFDGRSLAGWSGDPRFWSVEDGAIVGRSTEAEPCRATTYLVHEAGTYEHFELVLEVKLANGNSGVQFRSRRADRFEVHGPQADHDDSGEWTGGIYEQNGRGVLVRRGTALALDVAGAASESSLGDTRELLAEATAREWDQLSVRCVGPVTEVRWNGRLTSSLVDQGPAAWRSEGLIALQLHAGPPMDVRFRNVRVTPLPAPPASEAAAPAAEPAPQWIWAEGAPNAVTLLSTVTPRANLKSATLWGACDNFVEVFAGEARLATSDDWSRPFERDVTALLPAGPFELRARCRNEGGPAGLILELALAYEDGTRDVVRTGAGWHAEVDGQPADVAVLGAFGIGPWGTPETTGDGKAGGVLDPAALILPAGFEASLVYEVPRDQGSWVSVTCDDRGRIYAADEHGAGVYRVTERAGAAPLVEALPLGLPSAQGLCAIRRGDGGLDLYVMVNAYGSDKVNGVWRARDREDDGAFEEVALLMEVPGDAGEHGPHGIIAAPDGSGLYVISGNHTRLPADIAVFHAPRVWQEDQLVAALPDPNGHAVGVPVPGGWFLKTDFDGQRRELVSIGMRNAYDVAIDREGNALTYDSDMEWDMGAPWYRAPRVVQLVPGSDTGWRNGSGKAPEWAEETLGSVIDTGPASPTGVLHTKDLAFHAPWDDVLLAADWAYGTVHAVTTRRAPDGAQLTGTIRPFIQGKPFPVTDLAAHPDGSLIVTIGGRGTRSGMYRVRSLAGVDRRATTTPDPVARVASVPREWLGSPDRVQRGLARTALIREALASEPTAYFELLALETEARASAATTTAARHRAAAAILVARALAAPGASRSAIAEAVAAAPLGELEVDTQLAYLRAIEVVVAREGLPTEAARARLLARLEPLYPSGERRLDRTLATVLVGLGSEAFTPRAVARMVTADTQEEALHLAYVLRVHATGWTPTLVDTYLSFLHRGAATFHGGHSLRRYAERIRDEATERLGSGWSPPVVAVDTSASAPPIAASIFVQEWSLRDLRPSDGELAGRDLARGRHVFRAARCAECHRFGGDGGSTGPDLTGAGARYSAEDLLLAILEPSRDLTDQYQDTEVWTKDGIVHMGRVVEEDAEWLTLMPPPPNEAERIDVAQGDVKLRRPHPISRMPKALLDGFRREEALDLVAYLLGGPEATGTNGAATGAAPGDTRQSRALEAELGTPGTPGLEALQRAFASGNPGYALHWLAGPSATYAPHTAAAIAFVQGGEGSARVGDERTSPVRPGDVVVLRRGESLALEGVSAVVIDVPAPPPATVPTFVRPDFDPAITDTPGGCAEEVDAYRRILLTWQGKNGPYLFHALNAHRVRIMDSFTHYHPVIGGFDELYLVQSAPAGAELLISEQLDVIRGVAAVTQGDAASLIRRIPLAAGDLVLLPRGVVHRGLGGAVVQVITVPGFVPGAEIGVDAELAALGARLGVELPVHRGGR